MADGCLIKISNPLPKFEGGQSYGKINGSVKGVFKCIQLFVLS